MQATDIPHPISEMESEIIKSNHRCLDLQYICDEQAKRIEELEGWLKEERANFLRYLWRLKENKPSHGDPDYEAVDKADMALHRAAKSKKTRLSQDVARKQLIAEQKLEVST